MNQVQRRIVVLTRLLLASFWTTFIVYVWIGSIPDSPLRLPTASRYTLSALVPQGWNFFTRDPREPAIQVYERRGTQWIETLRQRSLPKHWFGLRRTPAAKEIEIIRLLTGIPEARWTPTSEGFSGHPEPGELAPVLVANTMLVKSYCGDLTIRLVERVPWAWAHAQSETMMPSRVIRLEVRC